MQRLLIVKTSSLGDIVQTFPVLSYLKAKFPTSEIDWVVEKPFADLVQANPLVSNVITIDSKSWRKKPFSSWKEIWSSRRHLKQWPYDLLFDLQGNIKSAIATKIARAPVKVGFAPPALPEWPNRLVTTHRYLPSGNSIREEYLSIASQHLSDQAPKFSEKINLRLNSEQQHLFDQINQQVIIQGMPRLLICPGSAWVNKQLTEQVLVSLLDALQREFPLAFLYLAWGSQPEYDLVQRLSAKLSERQIILPKLPLPVLQNVMSQMDCIIAMDSLPLHLAATSGTATFSVFGASSAAKYAPKGALHQAFQGTCPYGRTFEKRCPILRTCPTGACIRDLSAEKLFECLKSHLETLL